MSKIFYQLYQPCGLFNQVMSIELAVGLSHRYQKNLLIHNMNNPPIPELNGQRIPIYSANYSFTDRKGLLDSGVYPKISDLLNWKNKENAILLDDQISVQGEGIVHIEDMLYTYSSNVEDASEDEQMFAEGRTRLPLTIESGISLKRTLGYYSRFFYNRDSALDAAISSVRFDQEYYDLASQIAKSIGDFNGIHFRLTDHKPVFDPDNSVLDQGVSTLSGELPIVMCTDQPNSEVIKKSSYKYLMLDQYILDNFHKEFMSFKYKEEVSFGILNNLVMHHSKDFVGSPGSTYTGYIHRALNQNEDIGWKTFEQESYKRGTPYSWNGYNSKDPITKQWWREWEESRLDI